jgi:hypothetical protein
MAQIIGEARRYRMEVEEMRGRQQTKIKWEMENFICFVSFQSFEYIQSHCILK